MRNKYTTIFKQTVPRCIKTIGEQGKIYTPNTSMHDLSISWHFNKNNGGVMLLLLAQVFPLSENEINHIVLVYCSSLTKLPKCCCMLCLFNQPMFYTLFYNNTTIPEECLCICGMKKVKLTIVWH
jgi:hypothetical protein